MKRFFTFLLAFVLCLSLIGCDRYERSRQKEIMDEANGYVTVEYEMDDGTTLEQQVLYEENDVTITALGLEGDTDDASLWYRVENNSNQQINVWLEKVSVNGWQLYSSSSVNVERDKMAKRALWMDMQELEPVVSFPAVGTISLEGTIYDKDYNVQDTFSVSLETSAGPQTAEEPDLSNGQTVYDGNGVKLIWLGFAEDYYSEYPPLVFYAENTGAKEVLLSTDWRHGLTLADGTTVDTSLYANLKAECRMILQVDLYPDGDWEEEQETEAFSWSDYMPFTMSLVVEQKSGEYNWKELDTVEGIILTDAAEAVQFE